MKTETIYCLFIFLLLTSCGVKQISTDHFTPINDLSELNGIYINKSGDKYLSSVLSGNYSSDKGKFIDLINLFFPSKDSLIVSYVDGAGHRESLKLKGEFKNNYFEYYLEKNRLYVPPFLMRHWTSKRRIGKDSEGKLEIHEYQNNWGALFIIFGGSSNTKSETFELYSKNLNTKLFKINTDDKWGYKNRKDSIVINPQYEYAQIFENGLAKVSLNNKWGYIDTTNQIIIPIIYDQIIPTINKLLRVEKDSKWGIIDLRNHIISPSEYDKIDDFGNNMFNDSLFNKLAKVYKKNRIGFINTEGEEVIPVEYEEIGYDLYEPNQGCFYRTKLKNKYGYVTHNGVFCDPIFDEAKGFSNVYSGNKRIVDKIGLYTKVKYNGKPYILGENGILYTYKQFLGEILSVNFDNGIRVGK